MIYRDYPFCLEIEDVIFGEDSPRDIDIDNYAKEEELTKLRKCIIDKYCSVGLDSTKKFLCDLGNKGDECAHIYYLAVCIAEHILYESVDYWSFNAMGHKKLCIMADGLRRELDDCKNELLNRIIDYNKNRTSNRINCGYKRVPDYYGARHGFAFDLPTGEHVLFYMNVPPKQRNIIGKYKGKFDITDYVALPKLETAIMKLYSDALAECYGECVSVYKKEREKEFDDYCSVNGYLYDLYSLDINNSLTDDEMGELFESDVCCDLMKADSEQEKLRLISEFIELCRKKIENHVEEQ